MYGIVLHFACKSNFNKFEMSHVYSACMTLF